ncbi:MAG: hypothetical protein HKN46_07085 [Acidimicrobiia bacterium]|nr:hypothetical protein [Acidimicrobiia bacterium]
MIRRIATVVALMAAVLGVAAPAGADPAGPTDFQNEILRVDPASDGVGFSIVGGDAFLRAEVEPGVELVVMGYFGEPYLRVLPDGTVEENALSPSVVLNEDRYGTSVEYDRSDAQLPPEWRVVGANGTWAWHDHRIHWMAETAPPGRAPGDLVFGEVTVPVVVDGTDTTLFVSLEWLERPFPVAAVVGLAVGLAAVWFVRRRTDLVLLATSALAFVVGLRQWLFLPIETEPSFLQWAVPAVAAAFVVVGMTRPLLANTAWLVAGVELIAWGVWRWESMIRAVLPTAQPWDTDRFVTALCLSVGAAVLAVLVAERFRPEPNPAD